jgi:lysophospholipase L1-like esterase
MAAHAVNARVVSSVPVKTVLCYGDSNTWRCIPATGPEPARRFAPDERWPGVLRDHLGVGYWVVEEGLNGRTTVWEDGLEPHRNGRDLLLPALLTHKPVHIAILMLGTNDLKRRIGVSAAEIAEGAGVLVEIVRGSHCGPDGAEPEVLLVCPPPLGPQPPFADAFDGGAAKSRELPAAYREAARAHGCALLEAGEHISTSDVDGVHLDLEAHAALGAAVAEAVRNLETSGRAAG